ncbi:DUF3426 domain-containing protein [Gilvimarinus polysaccharolyticus]|uniref:DUF3426 domain-containing protein n=1 Tax=Gilvimarinus polysaccharolyticus TaxID=863921 RepID=UPI0006738DAD|nr:DUF3426 domain-containing protein [Gilvimarinus polysaccharolyticus]
MTQLVTRCPQCSTSFRITPAQIQKARGAVRCGSCLHIFNAEQNLIEGRNPKPAAPRVKTTKRAPQTPAPTQTQLPITSEPDAAVPSTAPSAAISPTPKQASIKPQAQTRPAVTPAAAKPDNLNKSDNIRPAATVAQTAPTKAAINTPKPENRRVSAPKSDSNSAPKPVSNASKIIENPKPVEPSATADGLLKFDQSQIDLESELHDDVLISDDMDNPAPKAADPDLYIAPRDSGHSLFERKLEPQTEEFVDASDESWADELLDNEPTPQTQTASDFDNPLSITRDGPSTASEIDNFTETGEQTNDFSANLTEDIKPSKRDNPTPASTQKPAATPSFELRADRSDNDEDSHAVDDFHGRLRAYDSERSALILGIHPEPVEMAAAHERPWHKRLLWGALSLLAIVALVLQVAWLQFDRYSRIEPYRGYYQSACNLIGCQMPTLRDTSKIRTFNLVVRQHAEHSNALMVDAIILNTAMFEQPYPALQLTFSDINNRPVASRLFTPKEYLRGELTGRTIMPSNQPVHLSLELVDPGPDAVNYNLVIP